MKLTIILPIFALLFSCSTPEPTELKLSDFVDALSNQGFTIDGRAERSGAMLSAVEGVEFTANGEALEIYRFDMSIVSGSNAIEKLSTEGIYGQPLFRNQNLLMANRVGAKDWDKILKIFESL